MKKLSIITEGILGDIAKRDLSGEKKKEDVIGNINQIKPIYYKLTKYNLIDPKLYYGWTSTPLSIKNNSFTDKIHIFTFDERQFYHTPVNKMDFENIVIQNKFDKLCIRLVKEK